MLIENVTNFGLSHKNEMCIYCLLYYTSYDGVLEDIMCASYSEEKTLPSKKYLYVYKLIWLYKFII